VKRGPENPMTDYETEYLLAFVAVSATIYLLHNESVSIFIEQVAKT